MDAIRYDLDGDGDPDSADNTAAYAAAFPTTTREVVCNGCEGYELERSLDFDDPASYASGTVNTDWTTGEGWLPYADDYIKEFSATLNGNEYTISGLYVNRLEDRPDSTMASLIGKNGEEGLIENIGLLEVNITARSASGLAADNVGTIESSYVTGRVSATAFATGGLVGGNGDGGIISHCYAMVDISGTGRVGGLVGSNAREGTVTHSYGDRQRLGRGLRWRPRWLNQRGTVTHSYATGERRLLGN